MQSTADEILAALRTCPPAPGFERGGIPGERERDRRSGDKGKAISLPRATWNEIEAMHRDLGLPEAETRGALE